MRLPFFKHEYESNGETGDSLGAFLTPWTKPQSELQPGQVTNLTNVKTLEFSAAEPPLHVPKRFWALK
jgi:hypothetical protein